MILICMVFLLVGLSGKIHNYTKYDHHHFLITVCINKNHPTIGLIVVAAFFIVLGLYFPQILWGM